VAADPGHHSIDISEFGISEVSLTKDTPRETREIAIHDIAIRSQPSISEDRWQQIQVPSNRHIGVRGFERPSQHEFETREIAIPEIDKIAAVHLFGHVEDIKETVEQSRFQVVREIWSRKSRTRETTRTVHLSGTRGVNPRAREKSRQGRVHRHIGIRQIVNPEDKKHEHFGTPKSEIPTGGKLRRGAQLTSSRQNRGIGNLHSEIPDADLSRPSVGTRGRNQVHRHYGIRKIADPNDETSGAFEVSISREGIRTVHHRRTRGADRSNREKSRKDSAIGKSEIGESRSQKNSSSGFTKSRFATSR
jgi:hypothetical protein